MALDHEKTGTALYVHLKWTKVPKEEKPEEKSKADRAKRSEEGSAEAVRLAKKLDGLFVAEGTTPAPAPNASAAAAAVAAVAAVRGWRGAIAEAAAAVAPTDAELAARVRGAAAALDG